MAAGDHEIDIALSAGVSEADVEGLTSTLERAGFKIAYGGVIDIDIGIPQIWLDLVLDGQVPLNRLAISLEDGATSLWQAAYDRGIGLPTLRLELLRAASLPTVYLIPAGARKAVHDLHVDFSKDSLPDGQRFWSEDVGWAARTVAEGRWQGVEGFAANRSRFNVKERGKSQVAQSEPGPFTLTGLVEEAFPRREEAFPRRKK